MPAWTPPAPSPPPPAPPPAPAPGWGPPIPPYQPQPYQTQPYQPQPYQPQPYQSQPYQSQPSQPQQWRPAGAGLAPPYAAAPTRRANRGLAVAGIVVGAVVVVGVIVLGIVLLTSSSSDKKTASTAPTTVPSSTPADTGPLARLFTPVGDVTFVDAPSGYVDNLRTSLDAVPEVKALFGELQAKRVMAGDSTIAGVLALSLNEPYTFTPRFLDNFKTGFNRGFGADSITDVTLAGEQATFYRKANGVEALLFAKGRIVILVVGRSRADVEQAMTGLITNANGHS